MPDVNVILLTIGGIVSGIVAIYTAINRKRDTELTRLRARNSELEDENVELTRWRAMVRRDYAARGLPEPQEGTDT